MKKLLLVLSLVLLPFVAWGQVIVTIDENGCSTPLDGIEYDSSTNTLTLSAHPSIGGISTTLENLTINLQGAASIDVAENLAGAVVSSAGTGTLTFTGSGMLVISPGAPLASGFSSVVYDGNLVFIPASEFQYIFDLEAPIFSGDTGLFSTNDPAGYGGDYLDVYYAIDYVDKDLTDQAYTKFVDPIDYTDIKPCTISAYVLYTNGDETKKGPVADVAKCFTFADAMTLTYDGTDTEVVLPAMVPAVTENDAMISNIINSSNSAVVDMDETTEKWMVKGLGKTTVDIECDADNIAVLNAGHVVQLSINAIPAKPVIAFDSTKDYLNTDSITITTSTWLSNNSTGIKIFYTWSSTDQVGTEYTAPVAAQTGTLRAWVGYLLDDGKYLLSEESSQAFTAKKNLSKAVVAGLTNTSVYTGQPIVPAFTLKESDATDASEIGSTNYDISYQKYDDASGEFSSVESMVNVGVYKITATAKGDTYAGSLVVSDNFQITQAAITPVVSITGWTYGATASEPKVTEGNPGNGEVTFAYKVQDADDDTYVADVPTAVGNYTVKATVAETDNYQGGVATANFAISKASVTLSYSTDKATAVIGEEFQAPTLTVTPQDLSGITYASSNANVATITEDGTLSLVEEGETTITASFAGNDNYDAAEASYVLTVERAVGNGYPLWVGDIQVTDDNWMDILGDGKQAFAFNPDNNTLLITNNQDETIVIESRLEVLNIYLNGDKVNKLKKIYFNNLGNTENKGWLYVTAYNNTTEPSMMTVENTAGESAISGFKEIEYNNKSKVTLIAPKGVKYEYKNGQMYQTITDDAGMTIESVANSVTIGQVLSPMDDVVEFNVNTIQVTDENGKQQYSDDGRPIIQNLENAIVADVLITVPKGEGDFDDEGPHVEDGDNRSAIVFMAASMKDSKVMDVAKRVRANELTPGGHDFAEAFTGMTLLLPAGSGILKTDFYTNSGYEFHGLIAEDDQSSPFYIRQGYQETEFYVSNTTYCYIYLVDVRNIVGSRRLESDDEIVGAVYSLGVSVSETISEDPPSEVSGGALSESDDPELNTTESGSDIPTAIQTVNRATTNGDKWFSIDGQRIDTPVKKGIYIRNGQKVVLK